MDVPKRRRADLFLSKLSLLILEKLECLPPETLLETLESNNFALDIIGLSGVFN